ncbi:MAG: FAD-dependent oxidoreductase [Gammaproteobacteria bacterium]
MNACDLVVVGAGIHGAGVAQAAAAAGQRVLLLEARAVAAGTSSRSSKLVHGGLRYLEHGAVRLVRESLAERTTMLRIAPDLVHLQRFIIPVYRTTRRRPWLLRAGLCAYAMLAGLGPGSRFGTLPRRAWDRLDGLRTQDLESVFYYHDAQTDDALLTRAVVNSACQLGAELVLPARTTGADLRADGVTVRYRTPAGECECQARAMVNAAGPWAAQVAAVVDPPVPVPEVELVQGAHLVLPGATTAGAYYVESPRDGRAVFVLPRGAETLLGTTESIYRGDPDAVHVLDVERAYLLEVLSHYFPARSVDVRAEFAGLRVLPRDDGNASARSRETLLQPAPAARPRYLAIHGGKLTTWRATAAHVLERLAGVLPARTARADTRSLPLPAP